MLRKNAAFALIIVVILTLGIGANTAIFTLVNAVVLKPLPVANPEELVLFSDSPSEGTSLGNPATGKWRLFSHSAYRYFREHNDVFQDLAAFRSGEARLSVQRGNEGATRAQGHLVSGNYFTVMGAHAALGRTLTAEDDQAASRPVAVASYGYWSEKLASDASVIGQSVMLNGTAFTIVGVMGPEFFGVRVRRSPDFWLPLAFQPQVEMADSYLTNDRAYWLNIVGRLKPGTQLREARASVDVLLQQFLTNQAGSQISDERRQSIQATYVDLAEGSRGISGLRFYYSEPLNMLMVIVALILLIACANVGNLLLSRSFARQREILIRLALGANRARLIRQLLTESVLLAALGGMLGVLFAQWGARALVKLVAPTAPLDIKADAMVLGFTALISLLAGVLFGLAPALRASRVDITSGLKDKSVGTGGGRLRFGLATTLVVSQVALSLVLLVGAGLFANSLLKLEREDLGFNQDNVLLVDIDPRLAGYKPAGLNSLYQQLLDRLAAVPGVEAVSLASYSPLSGNSRTSNISVEGYTPRDDEDMIISHLLVGPSYSETLGLPLLVGREIGPQDTPASRKVAVV
ncbi:MAG TPA: ABC transporter permease, partial [Blastocatellia bacterium]|nr:ABC transporter permease [Blastocatellia bacterium]